MARYPKHIKRNCWGKIVNDGMGGFLCPPKYPECTKSVKSVFGNTFFMSLSSAAECEWIDPITKGKARGILKRWTNNRPAIESPGIQNWISEVLQYFKNCYQSNSGSWDAKDLFIDTTGEINPWLWQNKHAGVHYIRKYYPEFNPAPSHFNLTN